MNEKNLYLRQNVLVEPLFNQWYAWSFLIAPATASMYVANWHIKILRSFISAPQIHVSAQKNPEMLGGPFIDYPADRVGEIKSLLEETVKKNEALLEFAAAIQALDERLQIAATGFSLELLYKEIPEPLQGYVELVYNLHNQPSVRFIEGLLYKSPFYQASKQSIALSLIHQDRRPFVLTTPRLEDSKYLNLPISFCNEGLDELFQMKTIAKPLSHVIKCLNIKENKELFSSFFTETAPKVYKKYSGEDVRIRYYGHACILLETSEVSILVDPVISYKYPDQDIPRFTFEDLPERINYVLITHNHQDHIMLEALLQLRYKIEFIVVPKNSGGYLVDPCLKLLLKNIGFKNVIEMDEIEEIKIKDGIIMGIPFLGEHSDLNIRTKLGYLIKIESRSILCIADSNNLLPKLYDHLKTLIGELDVMFIGMECDGAPLTWLYGPLLTKSIARKVDQSRRLNGSDFERAIGIIERLNPHQVYVYAMGQEPWITHLTSISYTEESRPILESNKLIYHCKNKGIISERLFGKKELILPIYG